MQRAIPISPLVFMPSLYSSFHNSKNFLFTSLLPFSMTLCTILAWEDQSWNARSIYRRTRVWAAMVYGEHRGEFRLALRRATSLPRGNKRDYVSYKTLVRWRFACALRGSARGFWFIDPLGLRPRGLCTVATRACHVNHAPPSYNYNMCLQCKVD